jgi:hypothetical protein
MAQKLLDTRLNMLNIKCKVPLCHSVYSDKTSVKFCKESSGFVVTEMLNNCQLLNLLT